MTAPQKAETLRAVCHLATTNIPASAQDSTHIRELLENIEREASQLEMQQRSIADRLRELERERQFFKPMLSPLRRIPLEVLGEIFAWALEDDDWQDTLAKICRVCKSWRQAAHLVPTFWQVTTVNVGIPGLSSSYEAISSWMNRSRSLPRTLRLFGRDSSDGLSGRYRRLCAGGNACHFSKPYLAKLLKDGPTLDHISLMCGTPQCFQNLLTSICRLPATGTSSWDTIPSLSINADWEQEWTNIPSSTFLSLPRSVTRLQLILPNVHLFGRGVEVEQVQIDIPPSLLQRLTTLILTCNWTAEHILKLLQHCVNLERLDLNLNHGIFDEWRQDDPFMQRIGEAGIVLPKLHTLELTSVYIPAVADLQFLKLPALRDLSLTFGNEDWYVGEEGENIMSAHLGSLLASFLRGKPGSPSILESLHIISGVFEDDALFNALKPLSSLKHLTVENAIFSPDVFSKISSQRLLPQLESLDLPLLHHTQEEISGLKQLEDRGVNITMVQCTDGGCGCRDPGLYPM